MPVCVSVDRFYHSTNYMSKFVNKVVSYAIIFEVRIFLTMMMSFLVASSFLEVNHNSYYIETLHEVYYVISYERIIGSSGV